MGFLDSAEGKPFYNLVHAVGANCPNHRDDVMMIQYMLRHLYVGALAYMKLPGEMKVDGICGPVTINWILTYQRQGRMRGVSVLVDGRVDRIRDKSTFTGSISKTIYTLFGINSDLSPYNRPAFVELPMYVPISNPGDVPPPSNNVVNPSVYWEPVPATGGI